MPFDPHLVAHGIKEHIAGLLQRLRHIHRAMPLDLPAGKWMVAEPERAIAMHMGKLDADID